MDASRGLLPDAGVSQKPSGLLPDWSNGSTDPQAPPYVLAGDSDLTVVGESHYQANLRRVTRDMDERARIEVCAVLVPEADNYYDPNAVSVWIEGHQVGHLSRDDAARYRPGLLRLQVEHDRPIALRGVVVGDEILGVFLRHDPVAFGIETAPMPRVHAGELRTGLSDAIATDAADDSYDLSWLSSLPLDTTQAIARLRQMLTEEKDPIDRHFMFHELEAALYGSRNAVPTALTEFDDTCRAHDSEMEVLRAAFLVKWGRVPWIQTYRQMCIRHQKAGDYAEALRWAERGLAIYGSDAARPEAIDDLRKRADENRRRLQPPAAVKPRRRVTLPTVAVQESLLCARCGTGFQRLRARGRKPSLCPTCRDDTAPPI